MRFFRSFFNTSIISAFFSFSAIQAMQMVLPLLAFPWLGRVLGPEAFGLLMYMCLFPPVVNLFMDWGLTLGGSRQASALRGEDTKLVQLLGSVISAKIILAFLCVFIALIVFPCLPYVENYPGAYVWAICLGLCRGINPLWFFQGTGHKVKYLALWDVGSSFATLILVFIFITKEESWPLYLSLSSLCKGAAYLWLLFYLWRIYHFRLGIRRSLQILAQTSTLFFSSFFTVVYTNGAQIILSYFLSASAMGIIVAVSKMLRALLSLVNPFTQTLFPEICILQKLKPLRARSILRYSLIGTFIMMSLVALMVWELAPWLIKLALGDQYEDGVIILRIMILAVPLMSVENVLGTQILVPYSKEKEQVKIQGIGALLALIMACILAWKWGLTGAAILSIITGIFIVSGYLFMIRLHCPQALFNKL